MTPSPKFDPAAWQPEIHMVPTRLDNGLTLLVLPEASLPIVSLQIHYKVGSRHELPGLTGISHLFEHLMFRGTQTLGPEEFSRILQAKGGEINAFTTKDHTSYFENLPAEHLELGLQLEADRLLNLKLDEETFSPELQVVISERKLRSVDSPLGLVEEQLFATAYTQHPYQWPVIGWDQDLHHFTLEDCRSYYRNHYHPGNMTVVIAGEVNPDRARDLVDRYFGAIPNPGVAPRHPFTEPPQRGERRAVVKKVSQVEALLAGYHVVGLDHPDLYPLNLLSVILSGGKASRFYQEFIRPGKAAALEVEMAPPALLGPGPGPPGGGRGGRAGPSLDGAGKRIVGRPGAPATRRVAPSSWPGPKNCALSGGEQPVPQLLPGSVGGPLSPENRRRLQGQPDSRLL